MYLEMIILKWAFWYQYFQLKFLEKFYVFLKIAKKKKNNMISVD